MGQEILTFFISDIFEYLVLVQKGCSRPQNSLEKGALLECVAGFLVAISSQLFEPGGGQRFGLPFSSTTRE